MSYRRNRTLAEVIERLRQHSHPVGDPFREKCHDCADLARELFEHPDVRSKIRRGQDQIARGEYVTSAELRSEFGR